MTDWKAGFAPQVLAKPCGWETNRRERERGEREKKTEREIWECPLPTLEQGKLLLAISTDAGVPGSRPGVNLGGDDSPLPGDTLVPGSPGGF